MVTAKVKLPDLLPLSSVGTCENRGLQKYVKSDREARKPWVLLFGGAEPTCLSELTVLRGRNFNLTVDMQILEKKSSESLYYHAHCLFVFLISQSSIMIVQGPNKGWRSC